jgi:Fic family protein
LRALREEWLVLLRESGAPAYVPALVDHLFRNPYTTIGRVGSQLRVTPPTAAKAVRWLQSRGLLVETTGRRRNQRFCATRVLEMIRSLDESVTD